MRCPLRRVRSGSFLVFVQGGMGKMAKEGEAVGAGDGTALDYAHGPPEAFEKSA